MNATERVMAALRHEEPDRVPRFDHFWPEFVAKWRAAKGLGPDADINAYYQLDMPDFCKVIPNQSPWPSRARLIERTAEFRIERDGWGATLRQAADHTAMRHMLEPGIPDGAGLDALPPFEPADLDARYADVPGWAAKLAAGGYCTVTKTGGPFSRTWPFRGIENFLADMAAEPEFVEELLARQTDLLIATTLESIRRGPLPATFVWIADDCAYINGPLFSPAMYERFIQPQLARMCRAFHEIGRPVALESEGDVRPLIPLMLDAGVDILANCEPRAGLDVVALRRQYGHRVAFIGAMCNTRVLPRGDVSEIRAETRRLMAAAAGGGLIMGSAHTVGSDVSVAAYEAFNDAAKEFGQYPLNV